MERLSAHRPMASPAVRIWGRLLATATILVGGFAVLQHPARVLETHVDAGLLQVLGFRGVALVTNASVYIVPGHRGSPFWAVVTPACSSLAPLLVLGGLAVILPRVAGARSFWAACLVAGLAIVIGNLVRIDLSILAGLVYGRVALVLFHNVVGSMFAFAYTLGGYVLLLRYQLPRGR